MSRVGPLLAANGIDLACDYVGCHRPWPPRLVSLSWPLLRSRIFAYSRGGTVGYLYHPVRACRTSSDETSVVGPLLRAPNMNWLAVFRNFVAMAALSAT